MAYKAKDQFFPPLVEGNVRLSGSSLTLGVGELAFVDISRTTKSGVKILSDFTPLAPTAKLAIRMGEPKDNISRSEDNKSISTIPFKLKDVINIYVSAPEKEGIDVDDFIIGFNGEAGSELDIDNAENEQIEICLKGDLMGMIGLPGRKHVARINLTAPIDGTKGTDWTMHEIVEKAFLGLKDYKLPGNIPITEYIDISLVNSENIALAGTTSTSQSLMLVDDGTYSNLGAVQAQYPTAEIKRLKWESGESTYSVIGSTPTATTTGAFVTGQEYVITNVGDTDFTAIGASANTLGVVFTATGAGGGTTGTADTVEFTAYQGKAKSVLKGCDSCPAGYTELAQGVVYQITLENDAADETAAVQALPGAEAGSAILNDTDGDINTYSVVTDDALTEAEIATFTSSNETAVFTLISADVADLCTSALPASIAWVVGETCTASTEAYTITLADDKCGSSRLAELQAAYPDLTIAEDSAAACQRVYSTTVVTNLVCDECDDIFRDVWESDAPQSHGGIHWVAAAKTYSGTAKMGIRVKGKRASLSGNEFLRDDMFFFDDSVEISLVGGYPTYTNESYLAGTNDRFTVKFLTRKSGAHNLGGNLRKYEEEAQMHFRGRSRYMYNNYGKIVNGQETRLEGLKSYIIYSVTIAPHNYVGNFQQPQSGAFTYHFPVDLGKQGDIESVLNKLAAATGLPMVQAISK